MLGAHHFVDALESFVMVHDLPNHLFDFFVSLDFAVNVQRAGRLALHADIGHLDFLHPAHILQHDEGLGILTNDQRQTLVVDLNRQGIGVLRTNMNDSIDDVFGLLRVILMDFENFFLLFF